MDRWTGGRLRRHIICKVVNMCWINLSVTYEGSVWCIVMAICLSLVTKKKQSIQMIFHEWIRAFTILTIESHIMVGEYCRPVALWSPADYHVQHPIGSLNVMFLTHTHTQFKYHKMYLIKSKISHYSMPIHIHIYTTQPHIME